MWMHLVYIDYALINIFRRYFKKHFWLNEHQTWGDGLYMVIFAAKKDPQLNKVVHQGVCHLQSCMYY